MAEIARPDLLEEGDAEREVAAHRDLPQQHAGEQRAGRVRHERGLAAAGTGVMNPQITICTTGQ